MCVTIQHASIQKDISHAINFEVAFYGKNIFIEKESAMSNFYLFLIDTKIKKLY